VVSGGDYCGLRVGESKTYQASSIKNKTKNLPAFTAWAKDPKLIIRKSFF